MEENAYLLDTNVANISGHPSHEHYQIVQEWLDSIQGETLHISVVSWAESVYGWNLNCLTVEERQSIRDVIETFNILPIDHHTARTYGQIRADLFRKFAPKNNRDKVTERYATNLRERTSDIELGIQENDLWIVSTAVRYNMEFVTTDNGGGMHRIIDTADYAH